MKKTLSLLLLYLFIASCSKSVSINDNTDQIDDNSFIKPTNGGVIITFDDNYIDQWYSLDQFLKNKNRKWKAVFCVSQVDDINSSGIDKMIKLHKNGHEIAGHGLKHLNSVDYTEENGLKAYIDNEIKPMIDIFKSNEISLSSFVYPYGSRNSSIDEGLYDYFKVLRGTYYGKPAPSNDFKAYVGDSKLVYGIGIDKVYERSFSYLEELLDFAKENNKVLILYAHKSINGEDLQNYDVSFSRIDSICNYVEKNKMGYYTLSDVTKIIED